jgi:hypothetical protein
VIGSTWARLVTLNAGDTGEPLCAVGACEDVQLWNLRTSTKVVFTLNSAVSTCLHLFLFSGLVSL